MQEEESKASSSTGYDELSLFIQKIKEKANCGKDVPDDVLLKSVANSLPIWAEIAKRGSGYVRCQTLGVYIITEEFFNQTF